MNIALIGGTGFVGSYLIDAVLAKGHSVVVLVRPGSESKLLRPDECATVSGDIKDPEAIRKTVEGCDAVIYSVGILRESKSKGITFEALQYEGAVRTIDAAVKVGVKRFLLMSANGVREGGTPYQTTKFRAEQYLQQTDLAWTIFRPSVIFGDPRGKTEFGTSLRDQLIKPPLPAPLFYQGVLPFRAGSFLLAPVHVSDVAETFAKSLDMPETVGQIYSLCGPEALEWKAIIRTLGLICGKYKVAVPTPAFAIKTWASFLEDFDFFPITRDQVTMLLEGNTCDSSETFDLFDIRPTRFNDAALAYLKD